MSDSPRIEELQRRLRADPSSIAFAALAEEYRRSGRFAEAVELCRSGLDRHPAYLSARVTLGRALIELDRLDEAEAELAEVLKAAPENLAAIRGLSDIHTRRRSAPAPAVSLNQSTEPNDFGQEFVAELHWAGAQPADALQKPIEVPASFELPSAELDRFGSPLRLEEPEPAPHALAPDAEAADPQLDKLQRFLDSILLAKAGRSAGA